MLLQHFLHRCPTNAIISIIIQFRQFRQAGKHVVQVLHSLPWRKYFHASVSAMFLQKSNVSGQVCECCRQRDRNNNSLFTYELRAGNEDNVAGNALDNHYQHQHGNSERQFIY